MKLGEKIKFYRKQRGLTLESLSISINSSRSYIWELENDNMIRPSARIIKAIADVLGVTIDFLLSPNLTVPEEGDELVVLVREMEKLSPELREVVMKFIHALQDFSQKVLSGGTTT